MTTVFLMREFSSPVLVYSGSQARILVSGHLRVKLRVGVRVWDWVWVRVRVGVCVRVRVRVRVTVTVRFRVRVKVKVRPIRCDNGHSCGQIIFP